VVENRRSRRKSAGNQNIAVIDAITDEPIGFVGNLSVDGMLLVANRALPDNALFQFRFELPTEKGTSHQFEIGMHEQWGEPASIPGQFWAGFRIIDIGFEDRAALTAWVNRQEHMG